MLPELGEVDRDAGEFWYENPFQIVTNGENLSAFERNCLFMNLDGQAFIDGSFASGADIDSDSRSVIATDMNADGAIDLLVGSVGGGPRPPLRQAARSRPGPATTPQAATRTSPAPGPG